MIQKGQTYRPKPGVQGLGGDYKVIHLDRQKVGLRSLQTGSTLFVFRERFEEYFEEIGNDIRRDVATKAS